MLQEEMRTLACLPCTWKNEASKASKPGSLPERGGRPWNLTGQRRSSHVTWHRTTSAALSRCTPALHPTCMRSSRGSMVSTAAGWSRHHVCAVQQVGPELRRPMRLGKAAAQAQDGRHGSRLTQVSRAPISASWPCCTAQGPPSALPLQPWYLTAWYHHQADSRAGQQSLLMDARGRASPRCCGLYARRLCYESTHCVVTRLPDDGLQSA
jgi:hypothetical protein